MNTDFVKVLEMEESNNVTVCFYIENDNIMTIGEKMNSISEDAYMNGYNWEAFLNFYLKKNHPELCDGMESDPEAGMYAAYYELNDSNKDKAKSFSNIIVDLIENEEKIYDVVKAHSEEIEWD